MIHTTNPIAMKIWLQFTRIEEYWHSFFLGGRSAFKGRIRSNPMINHDESCLNRIVIESRHRGIVMNSRSFSNIGFYKRNLRQNQRPFDLMKPGWTATIARVRWPMIPRRGFTFLLSFRSSDFNRTVVMPPRVTPRCADFAINPHRPMFHLRDQRLHLEHVLLMMIGRTRVHTINAPYVTWLYPTPVVLPRVLHI